MQNKTTAKDFFLHVSVTALLYAGTIALLNVLFRAINATFPQVGAYNYYSSQSVSFPVATLVVVFPLFLILSNVLRKGYAAEPMLKEYAVRKWLIYITLFIAGAVLAGDLITVIYYFLDGRDLTAAFLLKFVAVFAVTGAVFGYYIDDLKGRLSGSRRNVWRVVATVLVIGSIILGFSVLGSPRSQRLAKYDEQRVNDIGSLNGEVQNFFQIKGYLPATLAELEGVVGPAPKDPETGEAYEYVLVGQSAKGYELCATFNTDTTAEPHVLIYPYFGSHPAGRHCFELAIDVNLYPKVPAAR